MKSKSLKSNQTGKIPKWWLFAGSFLTCSQILTLFFFETMNECILYSRFYSLTGTSSYREMLFQNHNALKKDLAHGLLRAISRSYKPETMGNSKFYYKIETCAVEEYASLHISFEYSIEKQMFAVTIYKRGCWIQSPK